MLRQRFTVEVLMADGASWYELCQCDHAEAAAEVVRVLLDRATGSPYVVRVNKVILTGE